VTTSARPTATLPARLEFRPGAGTPGRMELAEGTTSIGRLDTATIRLASAAVSKRHAEIEGTGGQFVIRDVGSRNGTFVNDQRVPEGEARRLADGDRIRFGGANAPEARFSLGDSTGAEEQTTNVLALAPLFAEALRVLRPGHGLTEVLEIVLDSSLALSGADRGFIMLAEGGGLSFKLARSSGGRTLALENFETTSRAIPQKVLESGQPLFATDLLVSDMPEMHARTVQLGVRSVVCLPLVAARFSDDGSAPAAARRIGVLYLDSRSPGRLLSGATRTALETLTAEAALALEHTLLHREVLEKAKLEEDLKRAAEIQQALLPARQRQGSYFSLAAAIQPCRTIGGDFFDYLERHDAFHLLVGDVAGKGASAALQASMLQGIFAVAVSRTQGPAEAVTDINVVLCERGTLGRLTTLVYAVLTPEGRLSYCNAGHCPPILVRKGEVRTLGAGGCPVGAFAGVPYDHETLDLEPGDTLLIFTDGVTEATGEPGDDAEQFGDRRLQEVAPRVRAMEPAGFVDHLLGDLATYTVGIPQADDVTAVVLRYLGASA
jgi:serine phosphatase RsbU (regulator of sigma subunit)/pSer/pThr/pTyr-binding forkhead associated (FHA) protein